MTGVFIFNFTVNDYNVLRKEKWYRVTNKAWNDSGINHPRNIGYLIDHISKLKPATYIEWERYFYNTIANKAKIENFAVSFREFVLKDANITKVFDYVNLDIVEYQKMVMCRLAYETWLGYSAEVTTCKLLVKRLQAEGCDVKPSRLSPEDDNKYAVDYLLYHDNVLLCGVQVKSCNYNKSSQDIVKKTIEYNKQKNSRFTSVYGVPVHYVYYKPPYYRNETYKIVDSDGVIEEIKKEACLADNLSA